MTTRKTSVAGLLVGFICLFCGQQAMAADLPGDQQTLDCFVGDATCVSRHLASLDPPRVVVYTTRAPVVTLAERDATEQARPAPERIRQDADATVKPVQKNP